MRKARARVFKRNGCWFYEVFDGWEQKVVLKDNTGNFRIILDAAVQDVAAIRRIEQAGHRLKHSYEDLVWKAARRR